MASRHRLLVLAVIVLLLASAAPPQVAADTDVDSGLAALLSSGVAVQAIATGGSHTCALTTAGGVKCWGYNDFGQLGDGSTTNRSEPVDVVGLTSGVAAIAAGGKHTCAVTTGGALLCWGYNQYGQIGDGTTTARSEPVYVTNLSSGVAAVTCASSHTCARTTGGGTKCWGLNGNGQLGNDSTTNRLTPVDVTGLTSGVAALSAGSSHTCAVTTGGGAKCWGYNGNGRLGDGTTTNRLTPTDVSGLPTGVAAISAGGSHTCALTTGGGVKCWGYNNQGQLGDWTTQTRLTPVDSQGVESGIAAVTAGSSHTCALFTSGRARCWGYNGSGRLGDGTNTDRTTPVDVIGLTSGTAAVSAGGSHSCAVLAAGGVRCWGANSSGQLGDGTTTTYSLVPVDVLGLSDPTYSISGRVTTADGVGVGNVAISVAGATILTDATGHYSLENLPAGLHVLRPAKAGYTFTPPDLGVRVPSSKTGQDFIGTVTACRLPLGEPFLHYPIAGVEDATTARNGVTSWFDHDTPTYTPANSRIRLYTGIAYQATRGNAVWGGLYCWDGYCYDNHNGLDLSRSLGTQIVAAAAGKVVAKGYDGEGYGNYVIIDHQNGYATLYGHLASISVNKDQTVTAQQVIGVMGNTGKSTGTHLHFGVYFNWNYRDPWITSVGSLNADEVVDPFGWRSISVSDPWSTPSVCLWLHDCPDAQRASVDGQTLATATGDVQASVPPAATDEGTLITLAPGPVAPASGEQRSTGLSFLFTWLKDLLAMGQAAHLAADDVLSEPATVTVTYDADSLRHLDATKLGLYRYDEGAGSWVALETTIDAEAMTATAQTVEQGAFDLQAPLLCSSETQEPDDAFHHAEPMALGATSTRLLDIADDEDWFAVVAAQGESYVLETTGLATGVDTLLELYDADGVTLLAQDDNGGDGAASRLVWEAPADGVYYARVLGAEGSATGCSAAYTYGLSSPEPEPDAYRVRIPLLLR